MARGKVWPNMQPVWSGVKRRENDKYSSNTFLDTFFWTEIDSLRSIFSIIII